MSEAIGLMIYHDQKLISEAFQLANTKFAWLPWSEQAKFKETAHQLAQDLLKDLKLLDYTIIRSETLAKYQVHLLLTEQNLAYILFIIHPTPKMSSSSSSIPIHLVFECCTNQKFETLAPASQLLGQINQRLIEWYQTLIPAPQSELRSSGIHNSLESHELKIRGNNNVVGTQSCPINQIQSNIDVARQQMIGNLTKIIEHQDTLEALVEKSQELHQSSNQFKKRSKRLNRLCCYIL